MWICFEFFVKGLRFSVWGTREALVVTCSLVIGTDAMCRSVWMKRANKIDDMLNER